MSTTRRLLTRLASGVIFSSLLVSAGCQQPATSRPPTLAKSVTIWLSFDSTGKATAVPDKPRLSASASENADWRLNPDSGAGFDFDIDFVPAPPNKCVGRPRPRQALPKPACDHAKKRCNTIVPGTEHYGCHAYQVTAHTPSGPVTTDPEIEVDN